MKNLLLTRYLYAVDEVIISLLFSLLNKKDLLKSLWWAYEIYYSEFNIKPIIWQIYYDFYAQLNPFLEKYIQNKFDKLDSGDETALSFIIKNLFEREVTDSVYCLRLSFSKIKNPNSIYKGKPPKWLEDYDKKYHNLLRSFKSRNWINTIFYLKKILNNNDQDLSSIFENINIQTQYTNFENLYLVICDFINKQEEYIELKFNEQKTIELWNKIKYEDYIHRLLALLSFVCTPIHKLNINRVYSTPKQEEIDFIINSNKQLELNHYGNPQIYNTIPVKRVYKISKKISCFALNRDYFDYNDLVQQYLYNWEYHCSKTPLWIRRFKRFGVCFDDSNFKPIFPNDDYQEMFYDTYGYEMDEPHVREKVQYSFLLLKSISRENYNLSKYFEKVFENINEDLRLGLDNIKISIKKQPYYAV
jgi:hypothetical protein